MRIENRTVLETLKKVTPIYIASDGKEYYSEENCIQHENNLDAVQKLIIPNPDCVFPYDEYINSDGNDYVWVNITTEADVKTVCDAYNIVNEDFDFGIHCIEYNNYTSEGYVYHMTSSINRAIELLEFAGYDTSVLKRESK